MSSQVVSSQHLDIEDRYPTQDGDSNYHLLGRVVLTARYYDLTGSRFATPDSTYTGFGADGTYYTLGVPTPGHGPHPAPWSSEAFSANRGNRDRFPDRILVVGTEGEVAILDADSGVLWMRFVTAAAGGSTWGTWLGQDTPKVWSVAFDTDEGVLYAVSAGTVRVADFKQDQMGVWDASAATLSEEPSSGSQVGSIRFRNTDGVLDAGGAGNAVAVASAWQLADFANVVEVHPLRQGSTARQSVVVGTRSSLDVRSSGLTSAAAPLRAISHVGPATGGAVVYGNGASDEVLDDDGDPTGGDFLAVFDFEGEVTAGMLFSVNNGSWQDPVHVASVQNDELTLAEETLVGVPTAWRVQANVRAVLPLSGGGLLIAAGNRVISCGSTWSDTSASTTAILNPSTSLPYADLPDAAGTLWDMLTVPLETSTALLVGTDAGLFRTEFTASTMDPMSPHLLGDPPAVADPEYSFLSEPTRITALAIDPQSGRAGLLQSDIPFADSDVGAATAALTYAFGGGQTFTLDFGYGDVSVALSGTLTAAQVKSQLEASLPGTVWTHLGAGRWRVQSLLGGIAVGGGSANATLGFAGTETDATVGGWFRELDLSIFQFTRSQRLLAVERVSAIAGAGDSILVSQSLASLPAPLSLSVTEPGGQAIFDDGEGRVSGDADPEYLNTVDYAAGVLDVKFAAAPAGNVTIEYTTGGLGFTLAGFRNPDGPPTKELG